MSWDLLFSTKSAASPLGCPCRSQGKEGASVSLTSSVSFRSFATQEQQELSLSYALDPLSTRLRHVWSLPECDERSLPGLVDERSVSFGSGDERTCQSTLSFLSPYLLSLLSFFSRGNLLLKLSNLALLSLPTVPYSRISDLLVREPLADMGRSLVLDHRREARKQEGSSDEQCSQQPGWRSKETVPIGTWKLCYS